ncbi:hypothetical protein KAW64_14650, partial [bacterium]|nr:hypothetical protein [bacterium]
DDLLESRTDMLLLAGYIESLIVTLPDVAQGNSVPYSQTMLYGLMSFLWPAVGNFMLPQDVALLRHITMQMNEWYVSQFVAAIG